MNLHHTRVCRAIGAAVLLLTLPAQLPAQNGNGRAPLTLDRMSAPIVFDGRPDERAWQAVAPLPLTQYLPVFRGSATQRSEIRVAYDDENLYVGAALYDTDASGIRINSLYRDRWNGDDALAIYIDAFNDKRNSKWFGITPAGMRFDQLVSDDGATLNGSWDAFWAARTVVTDSGWFAEVRIPFSTLGFRADADGRAVMGMTLTRLVARLNERVTFPEIDPRYEFRQPSVAHEVELQNVQTRRPLYITPYVLGGEQRNNRATPATVTKPREAGLDIRYPVTPTLTLDLTANTDFAHVESDDQQVNLDRFPLFFPERRRFFQEGSGVFDFSTGGSSLLFHSRRIGLAADGTPIPVIGGVRLVGRAGGWDVGALDIVTEGAAGAHEQNYGVLRARRPVLNPHSTAGVMVTSYTSGGAHNHVVGGDAVLRLSNDFYLSGKVAASTDSRDTSGMPALERGHLDLRAERRTQRGLAWSATLTRSGRDYRPEMGFLPRRDFTTNNYLANWYFFTDSNPFFRRIYPGALAFSTYRNRDGALESGQYAFWVQWDTKSGGGGWLEPKWFRENVAAPFRIGNAIDIPAGTYDFADLQAVGYQGSGSRFRTSVDARAGTYFDGRRVQAIVAPTWNASRHVELGADYQWTHLDFDVRNQRTDINLVRLRVRSALDARASGNAFVQYNSTTDRIDVNVRLRYAFAEGTDLWVVYNEGLATERETDPLGGLTPRSLSRSLLVKYSHTFGL